jgi:outer membrane cobalamin receptor
MRAEVLADELTSSSLTFGRYRTRTLTKLALVPEKSWTTGDGDRTVVRVGAAHEDTNRIGGTVSPVFEVTREFPAAALRRFQLSYTKTSQLPTYTALNSSPTAGLFRGNPDLGRGKAHNLEVGVAGAVARWHAAAAVFWRRDDSLVDWTFRRGVTARTANAVDIDVGGVELVARRSWASPDLCCRSSFARVERGCGCPVR